MTAMTRRSAIWTDRATARAYVELAAELYKGREIERESAGEAARFLLSKFRVERSSVAVSRATARASA